MEPLPDHLAALHKALQDEERAEREQLAAWEDLGLDERVAGGVSLPLCTVFESERAGKRFRVSARAAKGVWLPESIEAGDPVVVIGGGRRVNGFSRGHDGRVVDLALDDGIPEGAPIEVRLRADPRTWVRYRKALERGAETKGALVRCLLQSEPDGGYGEGARLPGLDPAQQDAAEAALRATSLGLIHGPPGTGKTRVIGALLQWLVGRGDRPWALADSNAAVDHLAATASARGLRVVRLGPMARIDPALAELSLDAQVAAGPMAQVIASLEREIARTDDFRARRDLLEELKELRRRAENHVLEQAQVLTATFGTLARLGDKLPPVHTVLVDEATQATEPAVWTVVPFATRLILVGDPEQLGPVSRVVGSPLETSLLQRLVDEGRPAPMLAVQHRMDTRLRELVADVYGPAYTDHPSVAHQPLDEHPGVSAAPLTTQPAVFIDTAGSGLAEQVDPATRSLFNPGEVALVRQAVDSLLAAGLDKADLAVLAPYSAQVARLREELPGIEVATVNAFQGRERAALVVSWVRSNDDGELGFVADGRRLTVTLTRARSALVQIGDSATLSAVSRFARVVDTIAEQGGLVSVFEPPWDAVL